MKATTTPYASQQQDYHVVNLNKSGHLKV